MKGVAVVVLLALACAPILASLVREPPTEGLELIILHNNDMHAHFEQTSQLSGVCTPEDRDAGKCYGGFPRVAHVVKEHRAAAAAGGPPVLYLNAGDTYTGTAWFTVYKWRIAADFINALQPDAVSLGNSEFDLQDNKLSPFIETLKSTILASNIILSDEVKTAQIRKSIVFEMNGVKVGVIGYLHPDNKMLTRKNVEYIDEIIAIQSEADKLQSEGVNILIALGHSSFSRDMEIAMEVNNIDLVIGGYKNKFFWNGMNDEDTYEIKEFVTIEQPSGRKVPVVPSYAYSKYLGKIRLTFDSNGEIVNYATTPILLDERITQDNGVVSIIKNHRDDVDLRNEVIGSTSVVLDGDSCSTEECNLGNLIADSIMYHHAINHEGERWTDAPVAIIHSGAIASSIITRPSVINAQNLFDILPTESSVVAVTMNGTILRAVLEHSVWHYNLSHPSDNFLQYSGIRVLYDVSVPHGSRVLSAVVRCSECFVPEFYILEDSRNYRVLMPKGLSEGENGYLMLVGLPSVEQNYDEVTCLRDYIERRSPVYPEVAERITLLNSQDIFTTTPDAATDLRASITISMLALMYFTFYVLF